jgi:hypothetical protein
LFIAQLPYTSKLITKRIKLPIGPGKTECGRDIMTNTRHWPTLNAGREIIDNYVSEG